MGTLVTQMFDGRTGMSNGPSGGPAASLQREGLLGETGRSSRIHLGATAGEAVPPIVLLPLVSTSPEVVKSVCQTVYTMVEATKSFQIVVLTDMALFKDLRRFGWPIEHIGVGGNSAGASGSSEALGLAVRRTIGLYGVSFVLECDEYGVASRSWQSLLEFIGVESEGLLQLAKVRRPKVRRRVELCSWSGWRGRVNREVESLTVGTRPELALTLSLKLAEGSSFGALVVTDSDSEVIREDLSKRHWNAAVCESVPNKSGAELMRDYESALDGLALAGLGFLCVVRGTDDGRFGLDFHLLTASGLEAMRQGEVDSAAKVRDEISRVQKQLERVALAGLATSTFTLVH